MSPKQKPLISLVTTTLNCERAIQGTATSIASQTSDDFEWVIQDSLSTDKTLLRATEMLPSVKIESRKDRSIYEGMNNAVERCSGEWVLFIQAGDWLAGKHTLENLAKSLRGLCNADFAICPVIEVSIEGVANLRKPDCPKDKLRQLTLGSLNSNRKPWLADLPCHQGILTRRSVFAKLRFDTSIRISADWSHLFQAISRGHEPTLLDTPPIAWYPNGGFSYENSDIWIQDVMKICERYTSKKEVEAHFREALNYHNELCTSRRQRRRILETI
jgi:glycosyltransferase involved in cell wall biosynthesis